MILTSTTQNGGMYKTATVLMTNAQLITMYSAPTLIVPAPPAGSMNEFISLTLENINGGTPYLLGGAIALYYGSSAAPPLYFAGATVPSTFLTANTVTSVIRTIGNMSSTTMGVPNSDCIGAGLYLGNSMQNFTQVGNAGTMRVQVTYRITTGWATS